MRRVRLPSKTSTINSTNVTASSITRRQCGWEESPALAAVTLFFLLGLIVAAVPAASAAAVPFAAPRVIASSVVTAVDVRSCDLDGDGDVDLVGSSHGDDTLRWYENNGAYPPTFTVRNIATTLNGLHYVDTGDVDDDGDIDVVASSLSDSRVTLHVNDGRRPPSFTLINIDTATQLSVFSCFSDIDGDGDLDVFSSFTSGDRVVWFENTSNRSRIAFGSARVVASGLSGQYPWGAYIADIDRDGDVDIAQDMKIVGGRVVLYASDGASPPLFSAGVTVATADSPVFRPVLADVNGDGAYDVVVSSFSDNTFAVHLTSQTASTLSFTRVVMSTSYSGPHDVEVVDLDGDGDVDVVAAAATFDGVVWFENSGAWPTPSFTGRVIASGAVNFFDHCRRSRPVDIDNDGDIDIVAASQSSNVVTWIENTSPINRSRFRIAFPPTLNSSTVLPRRNPHPSLGDALTVRLLHVDGGYRQLATSPCTLNGIDASFVVVCGVVARSLRAERGVDKHGTAGLAMEWAVCGLHAE
jgi:hypothetical protein